jgi:integrase/recombinase XerD
MNLRLTYSAASPPSASPYRVQDDQDREVDWANQFLDAQRLRGLSLRSLRAYAYDLLHFLRWWNPLVQPPLSALNESHLLGYVRFQLDSQPQPTPQTINHRLVVLGCCCRFHQPAGNPANPGVGRRPPVYGRKNWRASSGLRLKQPRRVIVPLSSEEVAQFWRGFRTCRDLSLIALMLFDGLRSQEVLALQLADLQLSEAQLRVHGKGSKDRVLPLPAETISVLEHYLRWERPLTNSPALFVSLKGHRRGCPITPAGLRSLFRHHRRRSQVPLANPHRFRHTFGTDMVRAGVSLPALMHLMGHAHIQTTMLYVQLSRQDVWLEYARATQKRIRLTAQPAHRQEDHE